MHTDLARRTSYRQIIESALRCRGTNTSVPITEACGRSFKLADLLTGVECGIGSHKIGSDHNAKVVLAEHTTLYLDKHQTKEVEARGSVPSAICMSGLMAP
jgi:hypothetical protein